MSTEEFALQPEALVVVKKPEPDLKRAIKKRRLGVYEIDGKKINVWLENGILYFRHARHHKIEQLSMPDAYSRAMGQIELPFQSTAP